MMVNLRERWKNRKRCCCQDWIHCEGCEKHGDPAGQRHGLYCLNWKAHPYELYPWLDTTDML